MSVGVKLSESTKNEKRSLGFNEVIEVFSELFQETVLVAGEGWHTWERIRDIPNPKKLPIYTSKELDMLSAPHVKKELLEYIHVVKKELCAPVQAVEINIPWETVLKDRAELSPKLEDPHCQMQQKDTASTFFAPVKLGEKSLSLLKHIKSQRRRS
jgi:hypothetical protein